MKKIYAYLTGLVITGLSTMAFAQAPVASFSINPNPVCSQNSIQVTDLSSNQPTSWSYTILSQTPPGMTMLTVQNPTFTPPFAGTYTVTLIVSNNFGQSAPVTQTISVLPSPAGQVNPGSQNSCIGASQATVAFMPQNPGPASSFSYTWSNGANTRSIAVSPTVTTTYTCIITATNGCAITRTAVINIGQPTITINSVPVNICPGSSSTLTATGTGPGPLTFTWSSGANTRTMSTNVAGVYDVTVTTANGCTGIQSYTLGTSNTLSLTAVANPTAFCIGNTAQLQATGATSYTWSTGAMSPNTSVSPTTTTTFSVVGKLGVCTGTTSVTLQVSMIPTVTALSNTGAVCAGNTVQLNSSGATTYTWLPLNTSAQAVVISPTVSATYSVRGSNPGCPPRGATITINVLPNPTVTTSSTPSLACSGEQVILAANGAVTYTWNNGSNGIVYVVNPTVTTTYSVRGSHSNGCIASSQITQSVSLCEDVSETLKRTRFNIYPNPSHDLFNIVSDSDQDLAIINSTGQVMKRIRLDDSNGRVFSVSGMVPGIYFIAGKNVPPRKIVISK